MSQPIDVLEFDFDGDVTKLVSALRTARAEADALARNRSGRVDIDVDVDAAEARSQAFISRLTSTLTRRNPHIDIDVDSNRAQRALSSVSLGFKTFRDSARAARRGTRLLTDDMTRTQRVANLFGNAFGGATRGLKLASRAMGRWIAITVMLVAVGPEILSIVNALGGAFFALAGAIAPAAGLIATLPGLFLAAAAGAGALMLGFHGVMDAFKAGEASTNQQAAAQRRLKDSSRALADAQRRLAEAQHDLNKVVAEYPEEVSDARLAAAASVLAEERAVLNLEEAQKRLAEAQRKVGDATYTASQQTDEFTGKVYDTARQQVGAATSGDSLRDAILSLKEAQLGLLQAQDARSDSQKDLNDLTVHGVKGTDEYRNALRQVADAQRALADAQRDNREAAVEAKQGNDAYRTAMEKLSPAGRSFVRFLQHEWMPAFRTGQHEIAEALLPHIERGMRTLIPTMQRILAFTKVIAGDIGDAFETAGNRIAGPEWQRRLTQVFTGTRPVMQDFLSITGDLVTGFTDLVIAAGGLTRKVSGGLAGAASRFAASMKEGAKQGSSLRGFFDRAWKAATRFWALTKNVTMALIAIGSAGRKSIGDGMLKDLVKLSAAWRKATESAEGQRKAMDWFQKMRGPIYAIGRGLKDMTKWVIAFGAAKNFEATLASFGKLVDAVGNLINALSGAGGLSAAFTVLAGFTNLLATIIDQFGLMGVVAVMILRKIAFEAMAMGVKMAAAWLIGLGPVGLLIAGIGIAVILLVGLIIKHWDTVKKYTKIIFGKVVDFLRAPFDWAKNHWKLLLGILTGPLGLAILWITKHWDKITDVIGSVIGWVKDHWPLLLAILTGPIGLAVLAITKNWDKIKDGAHTVVSFVKDKFGSLIDWFTTIGSTIAQYVSFDALAEGFRAVLATIVDLWNSVDFGIHIEIPDWVPKVGGKGFSVDDVFPDISGFRAAGGAVQKGRSYVVGERRAEVFTPDSSGRIWPSERAAANAQGNGGGVSRADIDRLVDAIEDARSIEVEQTFNEKADPKAISNELAWAIR